MSETTTSAPPPRPKRGRESAGDMVRSLFVVLVLVVVVIALAVRPHPTSTVHRFDYSEVLAQARSTAGYAVAAPVGLPRSWRATSARSGQDGSAVTWHLGFVTPHDDYAAVEQSSGDRAGLLDALAAGAHRSGQVTIQGRTWRRLESGDPEPRALLLVGGGRVTTVVAGSAAWPELRRLAAALPVPTAG